MSFYERCNIHFLCKCLSQLYTLVWWGFLTISSRPAIGEPGICFGFRLLSLKSSATWLNLTWRTEVLPGNLFDWSFPPWCTVYWRLTSGENAWLWFVGELAPSPDHSCQLPGVPLTLHVLLWSLEWILLRSHVHKKIRLMCFKCFSLKKSKEPTWRAINADNVLIFFIFHKSNVSQV